MNNRFLLCSLLCVAMLYFALPKLSPGAPGIEGAFAIAWLVFALIVLAGNLSALLFSPKKTSDGDKKTPKVKRRMYS